MCNAFEARIPTKPNKEYPTLQLCSTGFAGSVSFPVLLDEGLLLFYPPILWAIYTLRPVSGTYFFANASFNTGHTHPLFSGLHDPDDIALPQQMIRWPQESPAVLPVALATREQRNPAPHWLPSDSKTLYQQGLEALTTKDSLHNANPAHWLPAYCAHALHISIGPPRH